MQDKEMAINAQPKVVHIFPKKEISAKAKAVEGRWRHESRANERFRELDRYSLANYLCSSFKQHKKIPTI